MSVACSPWPIPAASSDNLIATSNCCSRLKSTQTHWRIRVGACATRSGPARLQVTNPVRSEELYRSAVAQSRTLAKANPTRFWRSWHASHLLEAATFLRKRDAEDAEEMTLEAERELTRLVAEFPAVPGYRQHLNSAVRLRLAHIVAHASTSESKRIILEHLDRFPDFVSVHEAHAGLLANEGAPFPMLSKAIEQYPKQSMYYRYRGVLYRDRGEYERATADYDKYVELSSNTAQAHFERGEFYLDHLKNYQQAVIDFDIAIEKTPSHSHSYKRRGLAHFHLSQYNEALADIAKALEVNPTDLSCLTWIDTGLVANCPNEEFRTGMRALADRGVALNDRSAESLIARASLLLAFGEWEQARKDLDVVVAAEDAAYAACIMPLCFPLLVTTRRDTENSA